MKAIKSFMYKNYGATAGDNATIDDKSVVDELIKKEILSVDDVSAKKGVTNVKVDKA